MPLLTDDNWSHIIVDAYLRFDEKLSLDDFMLLHGRRINQNSLHYLFIQIAKREYVELTNEFLVALAVAGTLALHFLPLSNKQQSAGNDNGLIMGCPDFEYWLSRSGNSQLARDYFTIKVSYRKYCDYERFWVIHALERAVLQQSLKLDQLYQLLAGGKSYLDKGAGGAN